MGAKREIEWTDQALNDLDSLYLFLCKEWSEKEAENLLDLVYQFEELILKFPKAFPSSAYFPACHLGLIHRNCTVAYKLIGKKIIILALFDNRKNSGYR